MYQFESVSLQFKRSVSYSRIKIGFVNRIDQRIANIIKIL